MPGFQTVFDPSQENLEMRLAEAEAYQKILEQQIKVSTFFLPLWANGRLIIILPLAHSGMV